MPDWLGHRASVLPDRLALVSGGDRWSFAELDRSVADCARRLAALSAGEGSRVATLLGDGTLFVQLVHAVARLGAVFVPLNVRLTPAELAWQLADAQVSLLVYDEPHTALAQQAAAGLRKLNLVPAARLPTATRMRPSPSAMPSTSMPCTPSSIRRAPPAGRKARCSATGITGGAPSPRP
jgi:O-succinylbenzoic acid--CoA ligase